MSKYMEKAKLQKYDEILFNNANKFYDLINNVYSFHNKRPANN